MHNRVTCVSWIITEMVRLNNNDRQDVGSAFPKVNLGVSLGAEWKGLDLNMFFDGNFGNKIYNAQYYSTVYNESTGNQICRTHEQLD